MCDLFFFFYNHRVFTLMKWRRQCLPTATVFRSLFACLKTLQRLKMGRRSELTTQRGLELFALCTFFISPPCALMCSCYSLLPHATSCYGETRTHRHIKKERKKERGKRWEGNKHNHSTPAGRWREKVCTPETGEEGADMTTKASKCVNVGAGIVEKKQKTETLEQGQVGDMQVQYHIFQKTFFHFPRTFSPADYLLL